ncbi:MAG: GDYXXLXY domain-containing protein [Caldilineaceae bacterium]|nr:GDYXXLXY domain-containing protein [Caldilineaceae bacterium]
MTKVRLAILWLATIALLVFVNYAIYGKEELIRTGQPIFLELAPVDPRSLIQGDYMDLRYQIAAELESVELPARGKLVIKVAANGVATLVRVDDGTPLAADERLLNYYKHDWQMDLGASSFFFQEGTAEDYVDAQYGELRVDDTGTSILVGLRGEDLAPLGKAARQP